MSRQRATAKPLAYLFVTAGCLLALATALAPLPTGSFKLSGTYLLLGILPYIVYGTFMELLKGVTLVSAGVVLFTADVLIRFAAQLTHVAHASAMPALYLCLLLIFVALPAGAALGHLMEKRHPPQDQQ